MIVRISTLLILGFCYLSFLPTINAQISVQDSTTQDSLAQSIEDERNKPLGDTTSVFWQKNTKIKANWVTLDTSLQDFEYPSWQHRKHTYNYHSGLGKLGTALQALVWLPQLKQGFRVGMNWDSPYQLQLKDLKVYKVGGKRPFTNLYFSMINLKNTVIRSTFAHQVNKNLYYSLSYGVLNYVGYFKDQRSRHENLSLHLAYQVKNYTSNFFIITNTNDQSENGGIVSDTLRNRVRSFLVTEDVLLNTNNGLPKHENRHQQIVYRHSWKNVKTDSNIHQNAAHLKFEHQLSFQNNRYKYFDKNPATDSSFYGVFQTNNRGMRHYITHQELANELSYTQALGGTLSKAPLLLSAFVAHRYHWVQQEPEQLQLQNFVFGGSLYERMNAPLGFQADASISTSRQGLDLWIKGRLNYSLKNWFSIDGWTVFQRYEPDQMSRKLYINQSLVWDNNNLTQTQEFSLHGRLSWPKFRGSIELGNHTITNPIYADTLAFVQQFDGTANILQLQLTQNFKIRALHLDNRVIWQNILAGADIYRLPQLLLRHQLYYEGRPYKTIFMRAGFSFKYMTAFYVNAYFPLTGQFHLQDRQKLRFYPVADVFVSAKIWQMRLFVNAENLTYFIEDFRNYYDAPHYPQPNFIIRLGISWQLFD